MMEKKVAGSAFAPRRGSHFCKRLVAALASCCLSMAAWCASGTWMDDDGITWKFDYSGTTATITGAEGYEGALVIPGTVSAGGMDYAVTAIGDGAFDAVGDPGMSDVESVVIPSTVQEIGVNAFRGCESLTSLELGSALKTICSSAFQDAVRLQKVVIPNSVTTIDDAFIGCAALGTVTFKRPASSIVMDPFYAFADTPFLAAMNANDNWADAIKITGTAGNASGCNLLATTESGEPFFAGTLWWKWTAPAGVSRAAFYTYGSGIATRLGVYTGSAVDALAEVGSDTGRLSDGRSFVSFDVTPGETYYVCAAEASSDFGTIDLGWTASGGFALVVKDGALLGFVGDCPEAVDNIPYTVTTIEKSAFNYNYDTSVDNIKSVFIPRSVTKIGPLAFYGCWNLASVTFADKEAYVDMELYDAFPGTPYITGLNGNDNWEKAIEISGGRGSTMGGNIYAGTETDEPFVKSYSHVSTLWWKWTAPGGVSKAVFHTYNSSFDTVLGVYTGTAVDALTEIAYNDESLKPWPDVAHTSYVSFNVTPGVTYYICVGGYSAGNNGTVRLGWVAYNDFSLLTWSGRLLGFVGTCPENVTVPNTVTEVGESAFDATVYGAAVDNLKGIVLPERLTSIGMGAFKACPNLANIVIPENVSGIGNSAFEMCTALSSVTFEGDVAAIDMNPFSAFYGTPFLAEVNKNDYWADAIELTGANGSTTAWNGFATAETSPDEPIQTRHRSLWWKWQAPAGATKALFHTHGSAFDSVLGVYTGAAVDTLTDVAFDDDRGGMTSFVSFDVTPGETYYICVAGYRGYHRGAVELTWETATEFSLVIVDGTLIGFAGDCPSSLTIPNTVKMIGDAAFDYYCDPTVSNLKSVVIPGSVTNVGYDAFNFCGNLSSVTFSEGLQTIDASAFCGCAGLKGQTITLPTTVKYVNKYAFWSVDGKLTLLLPRSLKGMLASGTYGTTELTVGYYVKATLDPNGGELADGVRMIYGDVYGDLSPLPTRTGHTFKGWKNGGAAITAATAVPDVATVTLAAQWQVNQYKQTFDANGGVGGKTVTQDYDSALTAPTVTRTGYTFVGWTPAVPAKVPAQDVTYKARWQVNTETVTLDLGGGTGSGSATVNYGTKVSSLPVPTRDHYEFVGWFAEDGTPVPGDTSITANLKLHARWKAVYYLYGDVGGAVPAVAATYDGYLYRDEEIAGTITVKVGKPNKKNGLASVKATVELAGGKKTLKAAGNGKALMAGDAPTTVALAGGEACEVTLGSDGIKGTYGAYGIDGARNVFVSKDSQDKAAASSALRAWQGAVTVAWEGAQGWNGISVSIAGKGKVKVSGNLADGTKVSAKGQLVAGEEWCCVPVLETKKSHLAFMLWLPLDASGTALPGTIGLGDGVKAGKPRYLRGDPSTFHVDSAAFNAMWGQAALPYLPNGVPVRGGVKWDLPKAGKVVYVKGTATVDETKLGDNPSALKLKYKSKDGTFSGSFKAYAEASGKPKGTTVNVTGVLVDGVGYGTATVKTVGRVPVTLE